MASSSTHGEAVCASLLLYTTSTMRWPCKRLHGPLAGLACALRSIVFFAEEASSIVAAQLVPR